MNIKKGDKVKVISGKDRNKTGLVLRAVPKENRLVVAGVNIVKKHLKAKGNKKGERISFESPVNSSNVQLICSKCNKPTRIGNKKIEEKNLRICKKCQAEI